MRAIVTDEQRRSRTEAGLPPLCGSSLKRGTLLRKGRTLLRGDRRRSSVTYSRISDSVAPSVRSHATDQYAPSSLLVAPQNCPAKTELIKRSEH